MCVAHGLARHASHASPTAARARQADGSDELDFREFVVYVWNYCTLSTPALERFIFDTFDSRGKGAIGALLRRRRCWLSPPAACPPLMSPSCCAQAARSCA